MGIGLVVAALLAACTAIPTATSTRTGTASAQATSLDATPTPVPASPTHPDLATATALFNRFMKAVASGDADVSWALLAPVNQEAYGSKAAFASGWQAFMKSAAGEYTIGTISQDPEQLAQWIPAENPGYPAADVAFITEVDYPRLAQNSAGFSILLAAPTADGWRVWELR